MTAFIAPLTRLGVLVAAVTALVDQVSKFYLLDVFQLGARGQVHVMPFIDFVLTRNTGISYGLFQQDGPVGAWVLLAIKVCAVVALGVWLTRAANRLTAWALGLIIGGAIGNAVDRLVHGWVADFVLFHIETASWRFYWYVFNLADVAIVAGVALLLYESLFAGRAAKVP